MFWKNKNKEPKKVKTICLQKFRPIFVTTDGKKHEGCKYKYANADGLLCSVPEYLMKCNKSDGYMEDMQGIMYPLQNIISITWELVGEKIVLDNFNHDWQIFFSNEEVGKMTEYK